MKRLESRQQGSVIVSILVITLFLTTIIFSLIVLANSNVSRARQRVMLLQAQYAAESGADTAIANFNNGNDTYTGTGGTATTVLTNTRFKATFDTSVSAGSNSKEKIITSTGKVYAPATASSPSVTRKIEVTAQRSSSTTSSSLVSRNIINIDSGVKNVIGVDVYVNGYIVLNKNTTNLIAENITVADKNTGATNCSIGGSGNLVKPTSFSNPGQTKTKVTVAYNNCVSPPGNASNANFDVLANQSTISKLQSTYVPWSQFMDSSYQSSPGGCTDWTSGTSPRTIPKTGNTKKTHYPDSGSNVSTSCGTSGDLSLSGTYNITDNVHIRASLCKVSACTPTFNNTSGSLKFIFVEGSINFNSLQTSAGSAPIVFVAYGADPNSHGNACPSTLGDSIYLGNSGNTSAAAAYFLANNGVCLDKAKFGSSPALGGMSGKNLYIGSSPGTPFDLKLDPAFPSSQIPIDLSWRAARYRRI